jgi:cation-transporting P-type ATPase E
MVVLNHMSRYHLGSREPVPGEALLTADPCGLSDADVATRVEAGLTNTLPDSSSRSLWEIFRANVFTLFNGIVAGSFLLLLLLGEWRDALFGFAAVSNAVIGVVQEYTAKRSLDRLAILTAPRARVMRNGAVQEIGVEDVVRDDVLVLRAGDQVPADALVLHGRGLEVDESLLTGESEPAGKSEGTEVLSGSSIVTGEGRATVIRVGAESFASRLTAEARRFSLVHSEIRAGLNRVLRWITWALLPVMAIVVNGQMQDQGGWQEALATGNWKRASVGAVASVIAMIPLGLVLLTSVSFAIGAVRLARGQVLIQELAAVEGLARVDVLCLDKTGTLTEGRIIFDRVHYIETEPAPGWQEVLGWFGADPNANSTARCLAAVYPDSGLKPASRVPFSSVRKWSAVTFTSSTRCAGTWFLGAPDLVLAQDSPAGDEARRTASRLVATGLRTLLLARAPLVSGTDGGEPPVPSSRVPAVLLTFRERVRPDAARTVAYFREQGVELRVISGDDPRTVSAVARNVGLTDVGFDARELPTDPGQLEDVMERETIFGRVTPTQKRDMIRALQRRGHVVAMTGDGVNDALALKEADIGVAMDTAAAATRAVARLVLLDGRFDRLPGVVAEGRRVMANVERVSMLFLTKTTYAVLLSVTFGVLQWGFPFLPRQLSVTDGITIGIPAFFLALLPNTRRYRQGFLKRSLSFAVPAGLTITVAVTVTFVMLTGTGAPVRTGLVVVLTLVALWVLLVLSRPLDRWRLLVVVAMAAALVLVLALPASVDFFDLSPLSPEQLTACLLVAAGGAAAIEATFRLRRPLLQAAPSGSGVDAGARKEL